LELSSSSISAGSLGATTADSETTYRIVLSIRCTRLRRARPLSALQLNVVPEADPVSHVRV